MKRREVLGVIGGAAGWPLAVWAQQPKNVPRIGFLVTGSIESPEARAILKAFDHRPCSKSRQKEYSAPGYDASGFIHLTK